MHYYYKAASLSGKIEEGEKDAPSEAALIAELQAQGLIPVKIIPKSQLGSLSGSFGIKKSQLSPNDLILFTRELATLLNSGLPLDKSLLILSKLAENEVALKELITNILEKIKSGKSLADTLSLHEAVFGKFYLNMIRAGELGGNLGAVLERLADYLVSSKALKTSIVTALIYPAVLLFMSLASLFVMLIFVVPQFEEMFVSAGRELPLSTQIVIGMARFLQESWWIIVSVVLSLVLLIRKKLQDSQFRRIWDQKLLTLPLFGPLLRDVEIAKFTRTLGTLLGNGVSMLKSWSVVKETLSNQVLIAVFEQAENRIKQGVAISTALENSNEIPFLVLQMLKVGEEPGRLEDMLFKIAVNYDERIKTSIGRMLALLEPILIITLGLMVGGIIVSILMAILSVNDLAL